MFEEAAFRSTEQRVSQTPLRRVCVCVCVQAGDARPSDLIHYQRSATFEMNEWVRDKSRPGELISSLDSHELGHHLRLLIGYEVWYATGARRRKQ